MSWEQSREGEEDTEVLKAMVRSWDFILSAMRVQSREMWPDGAFAVTELVGLNAKGKCRALCSKIENFKRGDFPGSPVVRTLRFHCRRAWVQSLAGKLGSHMPRGGKKKKKNFKTEKDIDKRETSEVEEEEGPFGGKCQLAYQHPCQAIQAHGGHVESGH